MSHLVSAVLFGLASSNSLAGAVVPPGCVRASTQSLMVQHGFCGDAASLQSCLQARLFASSTSLTAANLEKCLVNAGCGAEEASSEALWIFQSCEGRSHGPDLRRLRRQNQPDNNDKNENKDNTNKNENKDNTNKNDQNSNNDNNNDGNGDAKNDKTNKDDKKDTPPPAPASTPKPSEPTPPPTDTPTPDTPTPASSTNKSRTTSPRATLNSSFDASCSSITSVMSNICTKGDDKWETCSKELVPKATCISGMLCRDSGCMELNNTVSTAGIVLIIIFCGTILTTIAMLTYFCMRDRKQLRMLRAKAEAAAIAKASAAAGAPAPSTTGSVRSERRDPFRDPQQI